MPLRESCRWLKDSLSIVGTWKEISLRADVRLATRGQVIRSRLSVGSSPLRLRFDRFR